MKDIYDMIIENIKEEMRKTSKRGRDMWKKVEYSQNQIKKAGKLILKPDLTLDEKKQALAIINNWRSSHAFPLNTITINLKRISGDGAIVVQRLKRIDSIISKLKRFPNMSLCSMQDLGGCRVITENVYGIYIVVDRFKNSRIRHVFKEEYDYIKNPKASGYRCYHLVYKYRSDRRNDYNKNMLIEIQIRTKLQHMWATAVETMGIYTKSALKASKGDVEILRFFVLVSSVFAYMEGTAPVPNTSDDIDELIDEIKRIDSKRNLVSALSAISVAIYHVRNNKSENGYYILILDYKEKKLRIHNFKSDIEEATEAYNEIEAQNGENLDTVLVSATSFDSLKTAYPNYFSDISEFVDMMRKMLA